MRYRHVSRNGQTIVESILILPIFLLFVFGLLQMGQIGVALVTASYAAGSIARHAVQEDTPLQQTANDRLASLMFAGMRPSGVQEIVFTNGNSPIRNVTVNACIGINPLPFIGPFLNAAIKNTFSGNGNADTCTDPPNLNTPLYFVPSGIGGQYYFVVRGTASARMNYKPT